jgi:hypothetical protein
MGIPSWNQIAKQIKAQTGRLKNKHIKANEKSNSLLAISNLTFGFLYAKPKLPPSPEAVDKSQPPGKM